MTDSSIAKHSAKTRSFPFGLGWPLAALVSAALGLAACEAGGEEPEAVTLAVVSDDSGLADCTNAEGWSVALDEFRVAIRDLEFTIEGEMHAGWIDKAGEFLVPTARAHGGHYAGGEVTGELRGELVVDLLADSHEPLGEARLLVGDYHGVNFSFREATPDDRLDADDPLDGHAAVIAGTASREGESIPFRAEIAIEDGSQMTGGLFELKVLAETTATLGLTAYAEDPSEHDTLFDGIDFSELNLDADGNASIRAGEAEHNILMKTLIRHDHWGIEVLEE